MPLKKTQPPVQQTAIGNDNIQVVGENITVNKTIIQRIYQFFAGDAETVDQRNRRIMLGHVENFWVKGILEKSLYGAALLELGIKEDPDALNYPRAIKRESTKETLPAGKSMLEIFQEIGMGRSLLILGAPGSGKTTMLLELTRQLIERARQDVTEPIPIVFNLSSWTEKLTLADWLARELNLIYTIPKKVAPTWVKENKMLLLLDGLDEVQEESRDRCVDAINRFRKENGLTSIVVCSRIQDYAELKIQLTFDGAIEIQPLTSKQVNEYFENLGKGMAGIRQVLEKDAVLREMAETPLFLSIMTLVYQDTKSSAIFISDNLEVQRQHLFDIYIKRMFERSERSKNEDYEKHDILRWLSWLAKKMIKQREPIFLLEEMRQRWLQNNSQQDLHFLYVVLAIIFVHGLISGLFSSLFGDLVFGLKFGLILGLLEGFVLLGYSKKSYVDLDFVFRTFRARINLERPVELLSFSFKKSLLGIVAGMFLGLVGGVTTTYNLSRTSLFSFPNEQIFSVYTLFSFWPVFLGLIGGLLGGLIFGSKLSELNERTVPNQGIRQSLKNAMAIWLVVFGLSGGMIGGLITWSYGWLSFYQGMGTIGGEIGFLMNILLKDLAFGFNEWLVVSLNFGLLLSMYFGGYAVINHYVLRFIFYRNRRMPLNYIAFLNYCIDLIFLRRVGGGYIFVHRLLMEHFAAMYPDKEE